MAVVGLVVSGVEGMASWIASSAILARAASALDDDDADDDDLQSAEHNGLDTSMCSGVSPSEFWTVHALEGAERTISLSTAR